MITKAPVKAAQNKTIINMVKISLQNSDWILLNETVHALTF
jgi:hypothetical protein